MFLSCRPFVAITTLSTGLMGVEVTSTPTRPVDNVIATKGLQDRNINIIAGTTVENKGKLILTHIVISYISIKKIILVFLLLIFLTLKELL